MLLLHDIDHSAAESASVIDDSKSSHIANAPKLGEAGAASFVHNPRPAQCRIVPTGLWGDGTASRMCSCCYPEISPFLPVVQLCVSAQLWQALSASPSFKPRENSASRCRQKGSIADEVIELHVAVLHRTQVSPPMVELGHELPRRFVAVAAATLHKADPPAGGCGVLRHRSQR
jgi:hypothetical protein